MKYDACTDEELIERLRQGETEITDYILEKYKPLVRKYANAMYLIGGETDDLIQEGMIGLFKAIRDFCLDKDSSFFPFCRVVYSPSAVFCNRGIQQKKASAFEFLFIFFLSRGQKAVLGLPAARSSW